MFEVTQLTGGAGVMSALLGSGFLPSPFFRLLLGPFLLKPLPRFFLMYAPADLRRVRRRPCVNDLSGMVVALPRYPPDHRQQNPRQAPNEPPGEQTAYGQGEEIRWRIDRAVH